MCVKSGITVAVRTVITEVTAMTREKRDEMRLAADHYDALDAVLVKIAHFVAPFDGQPTQRSATIELTTVNLCDGHRVSIAEIIGTGCLVRQRYANLLRDEIIDAVMRVQAKASDEIRSLGETTAAPLGNGAG
jgi:hypothetical protein